MNQLEEIIAAEIGKHGVIPFARFMELSLYCPVYGYYERERDTVGRRGDFFTSVSVGGLFGQLLAFQFADWLEGLRLVAPKHSEGGSAECGLRIVEAGAHDGRLAKDVLLWLRERRKKMFQQLEYCIVEPSERRLQWQKETLAELKDKVRWTADLSGLEATPQSATPMNREHATGAGVGNSDESRARDDSRCRQFTIIFSNELLDSMPVRRLGWDAAGKTWFEWGVKLDSGQFAWARMPLEILNSKFQIPNLPDKLLGLLPQDFTVEISPEAERWWREAAEILRTGKLLTVDYGLTAEEFFAPERSGGTLRAYHRHRLSSDLLADAGGQDLTAHVNFTALRQAGEAAGLKTEAFLTQAKFLTGIAERIWKSPEGFGGWSPAHTRQFQTLTHPEHLGRSFRGLVQSR